MSWDAEGGQHGGGALARPYRRARLGVASISIDIKDFRGICSLFNRRTSFVYARVQVNARPGVVTLLPGEFGGDADGHLDAFRGALLAEPATPPA
ncbi:hypothetical protein ABWH74_005659 [Burkholderia vietnamiensis]|uniref:hypothetical protein n=1 Tax=Burkholderia vietnamiensis TaxID=60552 RepID=UPI0012D8B6BD|nr:hypothetical protein [Burkholderia vietnamiensis]MBR8283182.1 hypothetical protein [Burkholderia vietnamiensis]MCA8198573.1 hypothetical protein [Burkholderia vietnamiensis]MDN7411507.1 hypothetical protein [Burkholderia vietnamiensis]QTK86044.1 hypothetical protein J4D21_07250 [Burkholderia vietnamiensis]HDR8994880.1 hypothetical protein [Burkholderia vietnamiensis]